MMIKQSDSPYDPKILYLTLTHRCNLRCVHCCDDHRNEEMDLNLGKRLITEARNLGFKAVSFTGGEIFLCFDLLIELMKHAKALGFELEDIATNACWWKNEKELRAKLIKLKELDFTGPIHVGADDFHGTPVETLATFFRVAVEIFGTSKIVMPGSRETETQKVNNYLERLANELGGTYNRNESIGAAIYCDLGRIGICIDKVCHVGRAVKIGSPFGEKWFSYNQCDRMDDVISIHPDGSAMYCLGYIGNRAPEFVIGNANQNSLSKLIGSAHNHKIVGYFIKHHGPTSLKDLLVKKYPDIFNNPVTDSCAFCDLLVHNPEYRKCLMKEGFINST